MKTLGFSWLLVLLSVGVTGCSGSSSSAPSAEIGRTVSSKPVEATELSVVSAEQLIQAKIAMGIATAFQAKGNCGAKLYRINYSTLGVVGDQRNVSGLLVVPTGVTSAPIASYQHGTTTSRSNVPSNPKNWEAMLLAMTYGHACYIVVAADYLGLGSDVGLHPFLHAETEASATSDMLTASISYLSKSAVTWDKQLFLFGYSQGGHATMALHRSLQQQPISGLNVTASAPMAGPYDLSEVSLRMGIQSTAESIPMYASYLVLAMRMVYGIYADLEEAVFPSLSVKLPLLFDGSRSNQEIREELPKNANQVFKTKFFDDVSSEDLNPLRTALKKNDVYQWTPTAPMRLYHGTNDQDVPFKNCTVASDYMKAKGADVQCTAVGHLDHGAAFFPAMAGAFQWFETLKR